MKRIISRSVLALTFGAACMLCGSSRLLAQEPLKIENILDRETEAMGGKDANQKVKSLAMTGKISIQDTKIDFVIMSAPNKYYKELTIEGINQEETVVNGNLAWKKNSITGSEILQGAERDEAFREAAEVIDEFHRVGNWRKQYKQFKSVGEEQVDGKPAYKVHVTTQDGKVRIDYFDKKSGLMVRRDVIEEPGQDKASTVHYFSDFRKVDGVVQPFTIKLVKGPMELIVSLDRIEHNVDIPEQRFAVPVEIKKLAATQK